MEKRSTAIIAFSLLFLGALIFPDETIITGDCTFVKIYF